MRFTSRTGTLSTAPSQIPNAVAVTRPAFMTGEPTTHHIRLPEGVDISQFNQGMQRWVKGDAYVQDIFSYLTPDDREFLMSGILPKQWAEIFPDEEEIWNNTDYDAASWVDDPEWEV